MPQLSSVITKILGGDFKLNHNLKVLSLEIWEASLLKYCSIQSTAAPAPRPLLDLKALKNIKATATLPAPKPAGDAEHLVRLADCFRHIAQQLYKTNNQLVLQRLVNFAQKLINL
jgi:hypothetical protein